MGYAHSRYLVACSEVVQIIFGYFGRILYGNQYVMGMERRAEPRTGFRSSWMYVIFSKQSVIEPSSRDGWEITSDGKEEADMTTKILEKILSEENLEEAKRKVMSNKGSAGVDKMTVFQHPKYIEEQGDELCEPTRKRSYRPLPVRRVHLPKDDGSK